jgi:glycosyltransferase involved in cell wall biosynthesis
MWLSLRGVDAEAECPDARIAEYVRAVNSTVGASARVRVAGDRRSDSHETADADDHYALIHHFNLLSRMPGVPWIRAELTRQLALADRVVFSVPSVYCTVESPTGNERYLPIEEWERILEPFDIEELRYYGNPENGSRDYILCVVQGQEEDSPRMFSGKARRDAGNVVMENKGDGLRYASPGPDPYPDGVTAIVHARNEERNVADCLSCLTWADEIVVCDMESEDRTVEIARQFTDQIVHHPRIQNFDRARNVSAMRAKYRWIFYVDADERVPPGFGPMLRQLLAANAGQGDMETGGRGESRGDDSLPVSPSLTPPFAGMVVPFHHYFAGRPLRSLYPGYTAPRVIRNGKFVFNTRLHSGANVDGPISAFPADNPDLALTHYSYDSVAHWIQKCNPYTDGESANMHRDGVNFTWQAAMAHFARDFASYYDVGHAKVDGVHGLIWAFLGGFYRFAQHAKLYETRFKSGELTPPETAIPGSVTEALRYMIDVLEQDEAQRMAARTGIPPNSLHTMKPIRIAV